MKEGKSDSGSGPAAELAATQDIKSGDLQTARRRRTTFSSDPAARLRRPVEIGDVLRDRYVVEEVIGEGGVGIVVAAHNLELDERVALKFLRNDVMGDADIVARFAHEAKAAVTIKSEHVARVFDVGSTPKGVPFLVMEYLDGHDLGSELAVRGSLPVREAVEYILQACDALAAAHAKGIIHRDIKPDNLFLVDQGERDDSVPVVKVLDFGISKAALTGSVFGSLLPSLKSGKLMGTPLYMSPEQIRSTDDVDARSDIWSLGMVLYEVLSGMPAFEAETLDELWRLINEGQLPPLAPRRPDVPEGLIEILERCMKKRPEDRFQNIAELAIALLPYAPKRARICAERAAQVLWSAGITAVRLRIPSTAPPPNTGTTDPDLGPISGLSGVATSPRLLPSQEATHSVAVNVEVRPAKRRGLIYAAAALAAVLVGVLTTLALRPDSGGPDPVRTSVDPKSTDPKAGDQRATVPRVERAASRPGAEDPVPSALSPAETATPSTATVHAATPAARALEPRPFAPSLVKPAAQPSSAPAPGDRPGGKTKPTPTADEPDLGY